jgi:OmpA-OmpF porin, OOP family
MQFTKQIFAFCLLVMLTVCVQQAQAQTSKPYNLSFRMLGYDYDRPQLTEASRRKDLGNLNIRGAEIGVHRKIKERFTLGVPVSLGSIKFRDADNQPFRKGEFVTGLDVIGTFFATKETAWLRPYLQLGPGVLHNWDAQKTVGQFALGGGLAIPIGGGNTLDFGTQFRPSSNDVNGWNHHFGFLLNLGDGAMKTPPPPADRDGDGVIDAGDKCPDTPGLAALMGCPDADGDGIADGADACPSVKGTAALLGCPDTDGDGIADASDKCPTEAGTATLMGCPDSDNDGIANNEDKCPKEAGPKSNMGCPVKEVPVKDTKPAVADRDGDGIADASDACPDAKGEARFAGCPDTDGDGIGDSKDKCPKEVGPASNSGCPEIKKEDQARIDFAIRNIRFKTGNNILTTESYTILDELAGIMAKYPGYSVAINGHTDSDGDAASNLALSERRAKACYDYLVKKGVLAARMSHGGFGETVPIGDNKTPEGKQMNRRVEFNMFIR